MSAFLPPELRLELAQLLSALQSSDNTIRSKAEEHLQANWYNSRPDVLLLALVEHMVNTQNPVAERSYAAVLFRRLSSKIRKTAANEDLETFLALGADQATMIHERLLEALVAESDRTIRNKIADAVAEIARQYSENGRTWPALLDALFHLSLAAEPGKREVAFRIFPSAPGILDKQHEEAILSALSRGFKDDTVAVRLAAMDAFANAFRSLAKKVQPHYFRLVPDVLNILPPIKDAQDSDDLSRALIILIDLAEACPKMFKPLFHNLVMFSVSVIQDKELSDLCRQNALELMATFADFAPSMCKADPSYTNDMITQCLSLMTDLGEDDDDAAEWLSTEDLDQDESDLNHIAGEQCMDRLANRLGGNAILAPTFTWLPRMVQSMAWRDRHAALMAISAISEGCREQMMEELHQVLELVVPVLKDPHPRVRWAGCNALGQMSTDFAPVMQAKYYDAVLKAIIPVLDSPEARVKSHAAAALVNFCEEADKEVLAPYMDDLLSHLYQLLQSEKRYVQEQALSTIATIADSAGDAFSKYYDTLMPLLMNVLQRENETEFRLLRAKAMECATLIALAVGRERLGPDAVSLVQVLASVQQNIIDPDDPQAQYLMHSWGRMCRVMGADFVPFLPNVLPRLLELATSKADVQLLDDEVQVEQMQQEEGWELVPVRGKMIAIRTSSMDDKSMAIELLVVYAEALEAAFAPYVADVMDQIALPGLNFFFHDPVRYISARLVPVLLSCYRRAYGPDSNELNGLWNGIGDKVIEALSSDPSIDTLSEMYECFYECVSVMAKPCLTAAQMDRFIDCAHSTLEDYRDRVAQREQEREEGRQAAAAAGGGSAEEEEDDDDDEELMDAIREDRALLSEMSKSFHCIFKYHGSTFLPPWERLMTTYEAFLASPDPNQRQWGLCIMDDVLEHCGADSSRYANYITQPLLSGCRDASPAVRQAAGYGIGVVAHKGGPQWAPFLSGTMPYLLQAARTVDARDEANVYATENVCAAIAKILHFNPAAVQDRDAVIAEWVETLPVTHDEEAAPYAYAFLSDLIEHQHPAVMSQPAKMFMFVAQALETGQVLLGQTSERVIASTKNLLHATNTDARPLLANFSPASQNTLISIFS